MIVLKMIMAFFGNAANSVMRLMNELSWNTPSFAAVVRCFWQLSEVGSQD